MATADICDDYGSAIQVLDASLRFQHYGKIKKFGGPIQTIKCYEDNSHVKKLLSTDGNGQVLVIDGGGSFRRSLCGGNLAANAAKNNWKGLIIYGCIRDFEEISIIDIGIKALGTVPVKTDKKDIGEVGTPLRFGGVNFLPGNYCYADMDGIVVSEKEL